MTAEAPNTQLAAFAYRPGRSALHRAHPFVAAAPLALLGLIALAVESPLVIGSVAIAAWSIGALSGVRPALVQALRFSIPLALLMILVNALISHAGATVVFRGPDLPVVGGPITLESLAAGGVIALRVVAVALLFALWSACVDPDRLLTALRPIARHSALTATLVARLVPVAADDYSRLSEAGRLRGPAASPVGRAQLARRVVAGSLERSVDVAATLELRGHSLPRTRKGTRLDSLKVGAASVRAGGIWPLASAAGLLVLMVLSLIEGGGAFSAYPVVVMDMSLETIGLALLIPLLGLLCCIPLDTRVQKA